MTTPSNSCIAHTTALPRSSPSQAHGTINHRRSNSSSSPCPGIKSTLSHFQSHAVYLTSLNTYAPYPFWAKVISHLQMARLSFLTLLLTSYLRTPPHSNWYKHMTIFNAPHVMCQVLANAFFMHKNVRCATYPVFTSRRFHLTPSHQATCTDRHRPPTATPKFYFCHPSIIPMTKLMSSCFPSRRAYLS